MPLPRAECEAAKLQMHAMEVQRMKDKETVRQQFEEIEHAFVRPSTLHIVFVPSSFSASDLTGGLHCRRA